MGGGQKDLFIQLALASVGVAGVAVWLALRWPDYGRRPWWGMVRCWVMGHPVDEVRRQSYIGGYKCLRCGETAGTAEELGL